MVEIEETKIRNYEELLWDKVVKMSQAKEQGNDYFFDELLDETEMLIGLVPEIQARYSQQKAGFEKDLNENIQVLKNTLTAIGDDITKDLLSTQKQAILKWEYRSDMLEMIFKLLNEFQMIPFASPYESGVTASPETEAIAEPEIQEPEPPQNPEPAMRPEDNPNIGKKITLKRPKHE